MNMQQMMKQAQRMQRQLAEAQDQLADVEVSATAGGGMVKVTGTAAGDITGIQIDGSSLGLDEEDSEMLQDTVLAAINETLARAQEVTNQRLGALTGGMGVPGMPGML
ncbi:MAG: YbaB/EbfC family nucleoid-associated protein [Acidobacteriota bacterium]|nr:YbaB/EbfC family nucleoid-associated protein [Acidobacteriota bacterium]